MLSTKSTLFPRHQDLKSSSQAFLAPFVMTVFFALALAGCAVVERDNEADQSFSTKQPCAPPCWYGLQLDKSGSADLRVVLQKTSFVDPTSIRETTSPWLNDENGKLIHWGCLHPDTRNCGGAHLSGDHLKLLWMTAGYPLSFEQAVGELGPPSYLDYGVYHPEVGGCEIKLSWPERGIAVEYLDTKNSARCHTIRRMQKPEPDVQVNTIYYAVREGFGSQPGGCCQRMGWPGFIQP